jgi:TonB family protein
MKPSTRKAVVALATIYCAASFPAAMRTQEQKATSQASAQAAAPVNGLNDAAKLVTNQLVKIKAKHVAIFDFYSPNDPSWDAIGRQIAADVRSRVDATPHKFKQTSYSEITAGMERRGFWQIDLNIADVAAFVLGSDTVDAFVTGSLTPTASETVVNVRLLVYNMKKPGAPTMVTTSMPFTPELKAMAEPAPKTEDVADWEKPPKDESGKPLTYTAPSCIYCPQAEYTQTAVDKRFQGVVIMRAIVQPNGKAGSITIVKSLPYGLDAAAVVAVRKWRFKPALGPDGQPAAVRQTIEVQFHLY